ncbi:mobile element protein [hydrocarbon metagenome]|uniref:Mobile element protein n=1 Tax=hydrocarbon metagenome TaxID=938273 RepID=A0A0W8FGV9_9ZZZZ
MDKSYDAEQIKRLIREKLMADSRIPIRTGKQRKIRGKYRRELTGSLDTKKCHRRIFAEAAFPALKRTPGESLKARKNRFQTKEIRINLILYNLKRTITPVGLQIMIELFYKKEN